MITEPLIAAARGTHVDASAEHWSVQVPSSKLRPETNPQQLILRPRLHALIEQPDISSLTLVVAPAGSGKTSLLRSWVEASSLQHAWLSVDENDRDPVAFWHGVLAALERLAPGCADRPIGLLRRPNGVVPAVQALLDDLWERSGDPRVLVLDDLHLLDDIEAVSTSFATFLQHVPAWMRVIVASRRGLALPVHRLRAGGQLTEVTFAELRFSPDEAADLLGRLAPALSDEQSAQIVQQAQGWAASIQLAAMAARRHAAVAAGGLSARDAMAEYLDEYVQREVLGNEPPDVLQVLMSTAVVDRISRGLGEVLSGRSDASALLALARHRGLFVAQLEPSGPFEVHPLIRDRLLVQAEQRCPGRVPELHALAAEWFEAHGEVIPALDHWLRAERPEDALRLLAAQTSTLYDGGHEGVILRTIDAIPPATAFKDAGAMLAYAWCHLLVDRQRFLRAADHAAAWAGQGGDLDAIQLVRLSVLQSIAALIRGDWAADQSMAEQAPSSFGTLCQDDYLGSFGWNISARGIALAERWDDTGPEVRAVAAGLSVTPGRRVGFEGVRALGEALAGRPVDALRIVAGLREVAEVANMTILRAELDIAEAVALREIGDGRTALPRLQQLAEPNLAPVAYAELLARLQIVETLLDEGDLDAAGAAFAQAMETVDSQLPGPGARDWLARAGSSLALAVGDLHEARQWAGRVSDPFWSGICAARILLAEADPVAAADALASAEPRCVRHRVIRSLLLVRAAEDTETADRHLVDAVELASTNGLIATVAAEGAAVLEAVERLAWRVPQNWLDRIRRATAAASAPERHATIELVEALTSRELEVLRLLPSRLTLREVAGELAISMNTLKFHLKVIYRKLGCGSRAEAAEWARTLTRQRRPVSRGWPADAGFRTGRG